MKILRPAAAVFQATVASLIACATILYFSPFHALLEVGGFSVLSHPFKSGYAKAFLFLFIFRYLRLIVGIIGHRIHRAAPIPRDPKYKASDVTAIIPALPPFTEETEKAILTAIGAGCAEVILVIPEWADDKMIDPWLRGQITLRKCAKVSKREQVSTGLREARGSIIVITDDHSVWPSDDFLPNILAPFEDPDVGGVAMNKRVRRRFGKLFSAGDLCNFIACLYLERHNFDLRATHGVEGSLFVISGRTSAYRASIVCDPKFIEAFCNEFLFFGSVGPLNTDDDNFLTRWLIKHDWKIGFQHGHAALTETELGVSGFRKFNQQCRRWARTTVRSNTTTLFVDRRVWVSQPWSVYSIYITSFFNFALFTDTSLVYLCSRAGYSVTALLIWIALTKLVKPMPHFLRNPRDIIYLPAHILFGYYHSLLKLWALVTVLDSSWGSRPGVVA